MRLCVIFMSIYVKRIVSDTKHRHWSLSDMALPRYLKAHSHSKMFDIGKDSTFNDSNANCKALLSELKRFGHCDIEHFPVIYEVDREALFPSMYLSPTTPTSLAYAVQFDVRIYFCRRGIEKTYTQ